MKARSGTFYHKTTKNLVGVKLFYVSNVKIMQFLSVNEISRRVDKQKVDFPIKL